ncbi:MAG: type I DNA topoisomerase [Geminicoccaceae bacterium]
MDVVVVESPTKAKTIDKYLGQGFRVLASYGHVRDLLEKEGAVEPDEDFRMSYEVMADKKRRIDEIVAALKDAKHLWLATDPDREGEAISWHLLAALKAKRALKDVGVGRVVFHEVTKPAVLEAMRQPRDLDEHLIDAYQARRALDYLVGYKLSPVLWRKLPGSRSAGRVQSVALRLICEREAEIEAFRPQEYWSVEAILRNERGATFTARLVHLDGKKLDRLSLGDKGSADAAVAAIRAATLSVGGVEKKQVQRGPAPPFSTSTLQQEAARKLGFSADRTMKTAQRLFEGIELAGETVGLITYMRTDSVALSGEALGAARRLIGSRFGERYLPEKPRVFKTRTKNAQEAHEAIRPTDMFRAPADVAPYLDQDQRRLYELIWQRTVASQMAAALLDRVIVEIRDGNGRVGLRATGQTIAFDGFLRLYQEGRDDPGVDDEDEDGRILPPLQVGEPVAAQDVKSAQHFTEPPPRYSEASLVKRLEELGIGRPSTYAAIISVLQDRGYVRLEQKRFVPEDKGRLVTAFLVSYFDQWMQPGFTAALEDKLDSVASGEVGWKDVLRQWWPPFKGRIDEALGLERQAVLAALDGALAPSLFPARPDGGNPRACPACAAGLLGLKLSKFGPFIGCSNYPECRYTRPFGDSGQAPATADRVLGRDGPEEIVLKAGRFGPYIQRGNGEQPKRVSLPPNLAPDAVDLATALKLLALPREVGRYPETGETILAGIGRYGPYLQVGKRYVNLKGEDDVLEIGLNRAVTLIGEASNGRREARASEALRELGPHPADGEPVQILKGRFGPYVRHGKVNASLRKGMEVDTLSMEQAVELLAGKAGKPAGKTKRGKAPPAKAPAAKAPAAKAAAKPVKPKSAKPKAPAKKPTKAAAPRRSARGG